MSTVVSTAAAWQSSLPPFSVRPISLLSNLSKIAEDILQLLFTSASRCCRWTTSSARQPALFSSRLLGRIAAIRTYGGRPHCSGIATQTCGLYPVLPFEEVSTHRHIRSGVLQGSLLGREVLFCSPRICHVPLTRTWQFMLMTRLSSTGGCTPLYAARALWAWTLSCCPYLHMVP